MNEDIINLTDILLNNFYLNTKNILVDVCYNLQILYKTQQKIYKNTNDFSNIIYKGIEKIDSIFQDAYTFTIDLSGNNNVILDYSSNLLYDDLGFIITRKNGDISYITQEPNTTKTYLFFNFIDVTVTSQSDLCLNLVGDYSFNYSIVSNDIDLSFNIPRNITVRDIEAPTIELSGGDLSIEVYSNLPTWFNVENNYGALIKDNYSPPNDLSLVVIIKPIFDISKVGNYTFTYTLTDSNNNVTSATRIVRVVDTTNPTFTLIGDNPLFWNASTPYVDPGVDPSDNYDLSLTILIDTDLSVNSNNEIGLYYYKYTIIDDYDNSVNVTRQVYIIDYSVINNIPVINIPEDASGNITNIVNNVENTHYYKDDSLTLSDNFAINLQNNNSTYLIPLDKLKSMYSNNNNMIIFVYGFKNEVISIVNTNNLTSYKYPHISSELLIKKYVNLILDNSNNYKLIVLDGNFNPYTSVFDPSLTILGNNPFNLQINTDFDSVDPGVIAFDYNGNDISSYVVKQGDLDISNVGNYEVLYIATDLSGHQTIKNRIVTVYDDILPVITLNGDMVVDHLVNTPYIDAGATVIDNNDTNPVLITTNNVNVGVLGTYQVIFNAVDNDGNQAIPVTRTVNVIDNIAPTLTLIGSATINVFVFSEYNEQGVDVCDNYFTDTSYVIDGSVNTSIVGSYTLTYNATDACGNQAIQVTRFVNVVDVSGPTIILKGDISMNHTVYTQFVEPGYDVSDNYDVSSNIIVTISGDIVDISNIGIYTLTYQAEDSFGNKSNIVTRTVNVIDDIAPVIILNGDENVHHIINTPYVDAGATVTDNYDENINYSSLDNIIKDSNNNAIQVGTYQVIFTASDNNGNSAIPVTRTVNVINPINRVSLLPDSSVNIVNSGGNKYVFNNGSTYDESLEYGLYNGIYTIRNVPSTHPIAFLNNDVSNVLDYSGTVLEGSLQVNGINYNFYSGTITLTVSGNFGTISAYCLYHGYMGAENKLLYDTSCVLHPEKPTYILENSNIITISGEDYIVNTLKLKFSTSDTNVLANTITTNIVGNIYQHPNGNNTTPDPSLFNIVSDLSNDSYFAYGDYNNSIAFTENPGTNFNNLNEISWFSTGLISNYENEEFKVLQLTLSTTSNGNITYYYADSSRSEYLPINIEVNNGIMI